MVELTRRDTLITLVGGTTISSLALQEINDFTRTSAGFSDDELNTLLALADVVYPSKIDISKSVIRSYTDRMNGPRFRQMQRTISGLDRISRRVFGASFRAVPVSKRDRLLRYFGVDRVQPRPDGTLAERIRFHLVNPLLYVLFTNPKGSTLYGIDNPIGHPGGLDDLLRYQESP